MNKDIMNQDMMNQDMMNQDNNQDNNQYNKIIIIIKKILAVLKIQDMTKNYFKKKYGNDWKDIINKKFSVVDLDYYFERKGIMDPWYDYSNDPKYDYK